MIQTSEAIVLRAMDFSNTSQILTFFTDNQGKVSAIAKGVRRKTKQGPPTSMECLSYLTIVYYQKSISQLAVLQESELRDHFPQIRSSLGKIFMALYLTELMLECTSDYEPNNLLFHTLRSGLHKLGTSKAPENLFFYLHWRMLELLGLSPHIGTCLNCQQPVTRIEPTKPVFYSPDRGGILCLPCHQHLAGKTLKLRCTTLTKALELLEKEDVWETLSLYAYEYHEFFTLLRLHLQTYLHKDLRLTRYLMDYENIVGKKHTPQ